MKKLNKISVNEGEYRIILNYYNRKNFLKTADQELYSLISAIAGKSVSDKIKVNGLNKLHLYFDPDYVPFLQDALGKKMNEVMSKQTFYVGVNNINLNKKKFFYIDQNANYRIIYPFEYARKSQLKRSIYLSLNLANYENADKEIIDAKKKALNFQMSNSDICKIKYFRNLPITCHGHGPHRDTWFGHTFGAINLWWSITGVSKDSGLTLYPRATKFKIKHINEPAYASSNQFLGKPEIIALNDGDLLVFDPEILHATKLNTSKETRIVFSGRINKNKPKFYKETKAVEHPNWFSSEDFKKNIFNKTHYFYRKENLTEPPKKKKNNLKNYSEIKINKKFSLKSKFSLIDKRKLEKNKLYKIKFNNLDLCMISLQGKIKIFHSKCPHLGVSLIDCFLNKNIITCPGHTLDFNLNNGKSKCKSLKLKLFKVKKKKNQIFLYS